MTWLQQLLVEYSLIFCRKSNFTLRIIGAVYYYTYNVSWKCSSIFSLYIYRLHTCLVLDGYTVIPDRNRVLEVGSSSRNPSRPAWILTGAFPSCFRTIFNSTLTCTNYILFWKKLLVKKLKIPKFSSLQRPLRFGSSKNLTTMNLVWVQGLV